MRGLEERIVHGGTGGKGRTGRIGWNPPYNAAVRTRSPDFRAAIDHLPEGAILALQDVTWAEYECVREELVDRPGVRMTYDRGRLEIMTPTRRHEAYTAFLERVVYALADHLHVNVESCGSTTWKKQREQKGTEPDVSFYVANAERILGDRDVDLNIDPPPDLVIEVDVTNESLTKLAIYATFEVPEVWRYDATRSQMVIYELEGRSYVQVPASRAFPILTSELLASFLDQSKTGGQQAALTAFRHWLRSRPSA